MQENVEQLLTEAWNRHKAGYYEECVGICEHAIQLDPRSARAYAGKARALYQLGRFQDSSRTWLQADKLYRQEPPKVAQAPSNLEGRCQCLEERWRSLEETIETLRYNLNMLAHDKSTLGEEVQIQKDKNAKLDETKRRVEKERDKLKEEKDRLQRQIDDHQAQQMSQVKQHLPPSDPKGYFQILGIDPQLAKGLPDEKFEALLKAVYRAYSNIYHPDRGGNEAQMKRLNEAYKFLQDHTKKKQYIG